MSIFRPIAVVKHIVHSPFSQNSSQLELSLDRCFRSRSCRPNSFRVLGLIGHGCNCATKSVSYLNFSTRKTVFTRKTSYSSNQLLIVGGVSKMSTLPEEVKAKLDLIADAKIDGSGKFKYILIKVFAKDKDGKDLDENSKLIVRGRADCLYHGDIFDKFQEETSGIEGIDDDILGGGRIERTGNKIFVYGYSQGYGKADHTLTVEILKKKYPTHEITWSDEGY